MAIKICVNCGENNEHSIRCHVVAKCLEELRRTAIRNNGGKIFYDIGRDNTLQEDQRLTGRFWCDTCERNSSKVDENLKASLLEIINIVVQSDNYSSGLIFTHRYDNLNDNLIAGIKSIFNRLSLRLRQEKLEVNEDEIVFLIKRKGNFAIPSVLMRTLTQLDPPHKLNLEKKYIQFNLPEFTIFIQVVSKDKKDYCHNIIQNIQNITAEQFNSLDEIFRLEAAILLYNEMQNNNNHNFSQSFIQHIVQMVYIF